MAGLLDLLTGPSTSAGGGMAAGAGLLAPPKQAFLPGLLADPWFKLGLNLMARGGPSKNPHSFGQDLAGAVGDYEAGGDQDMQRQLMALKLKSEQSLSDSDAQMMPMMKALLAQQQQPDAQAPPDDIGAKIAAPGGAPMPMQAPQPPPQLANGPDDLASMVGPIAQKYGIDPRLVQSMIQSESNWNPKAVSNKGARGLMQVMPQTAAGDLGISDPEKLYDPATNLDAGARYFKMMREKFGNDRDALRAYNAGPGNASMSKTLGGDYADTILKRIAQAAPEKAAPAPASAPSATDMASIPQPILQQMKISAAMEAMGTEHPSRAFMAALGKQMAQYNMRESKPSGTWSQPFEAQGPDGKPVLVQSHSGTGEVRPAPGDYKPKVGGGTPPKGLAWGPDDANGQPTLVPIKGGQYDKTNKTLPQGREKRFEDLGGQAAQIRGARSTFKDEYASQGVMGMGGETALLAGRTLGIGADQKAVDWWQGYDRYKNVVRNQLFGSALTPSEQAAFEKADVNANMSAETIKSNLATQEGIINGAIKRRTLAAEKEGLNVDAINELTGGYEDSAGAAPGAKAPKIIKYDAQGNRIP